MPSFPRERVLVVDIRLLEWRSQLDEVEQASIELIDDWSLVVCNKSTAHSTCVGTVSRRRYGWPGDVSSWPWHLHRSRPKHENSRTANRVVVFRHTPEVAQIRWHIPPSKFQTLAVALVLLRLDYGNGVLVGLPSYLLGRLQTVLNVSARKIFQLRSSEKITDALASLSWLRVPERIQFNIAVLTHKVLHGTLPHYLGPLVRVSDLPGRRSLCSASTDRLVVPSFKFSTIGSRTFKVAAAQTWNALPEDVTSSSTLPIVRKRLKAHLFRQS